MVAVTLHNVFKSKKDENFNISIHYLRYISTIAYLLISFYFLPSMELLKFYVFIGKFVKLINYHQKNFFNLKDIDIKREIICIYSNYLLFYLLYIYLLFILFKFIYNITTVLPVVLNIISL